MADLTVALNSSSAYIYDQYGASADMAKITHKLNVTFDIIIGITMMLCFFALSANMQTNIYEQKKEIGVLRALGMTRVRVILLFFYEAIVLVLSSSVLGIITGVIVAQTMCLQQAILNGT